MELKKRQMTNFCEVKVSRIPRNLGYSSVGYDYGGANGRKIELEQLLPIEKVARLIGIKVSTVRAWIRQRRIPFIKVGDSIRFSPKAIYNWVEAHKKPATRSV